MVTAKKMVAAKKPAKETVSLSAKKNDPISKLNNGKTTAAVDPRKSDVQKTTKIIGKVAAAKNSAEKKAAQKTNSKIPVLKSDTGITKKQSSDNNKADSIKSSKSLTTAVQIPKAEQSPAIKSPVIKAPVKVSNTVKSSLKKELDSKILLASKKPAGVNKVLASPVVIKPTVAELKTEEKSTPVKKKPQPVAETTAAPVSAKLKPAPLNLPTAPATVSSKPPAVAKTTISKGGVWPFPVGTKP